MTGTSAVSTTVAKAAATAGTRYMFPTNPQSIESIALDAADANGRVTLTMRVAGADQKIEASPDAWTKQTVTLRGAPDAIATSGAWSADDTYKLSIVRYQTPFTAQYHAALRRRSTHPRHRTQRRPTRRPQDPTDRQTRHVDQRAAVRRQRRVRPSAKRPPASPELVNATEGPVR